ncbi:MAG: hypothetical protein AAFU79_08650 [Myxococcota bacterium]
MDLTDVVSLDWSAEASWVGAPRVEGLNGNLSFEMEELSSGLRLYPLPRWPGGETIFVDLTGALVDSEGASIDVASISFTVVGRADERPSEVVIRRPVPGKSAPANLNWVVLAGTAPGETYALEDDVGGRWELAPELETPGHFRIVPKLVCSPECPPRWLRLVGPRVSSTESLVLIRTGTVADRVPPGVTAQARALPGRLEVEVTASEVVRVSGAWQSKGDRGLLESMDMPGVRLWLRSNGALPEDETLTAEIVAEDLAGETARTELSVQTPTPVFARISEVVTSPRRDWGDSIPAGVPFDGYPGAGTVSAADEWIELVNAGETAMDTDRVGLELRVLDGTPSVFRVVDAPGAFFGDDGSWTTWFPGEALVVRPRGDTAQSGVAIELWAGDVRLDRVVLGTLRGADHPGGAPPSLSHESLARGADGVFRWCRPTPGDPSPPVDCSKE